MRHIEALVAYISIKQRNTAQTAVIYAVSVLVGAGGAILIFYNIASAVSLFEQLLIIIAAIFGLLFTAYAMIHVYLLVVQQRGLNKSRAHITQQQHGWRFALWMWLQNTLWMLLAVGGSWLLLDTYGFSIVAMAIIAGLLTTGIFALFSSLRISTMKYLGYCWIATTQLFDLAGRNIWQFLNSGLSPIGRFEQASNSTTSQQQFTIQRMIETYQRAEQNQPLPAPVNLWPGRHIGLLAIRELSYRATVLVFSLLIVGSSTWLFLLILLQFVDESTLQLDGEQVAQTELLETPLPEDPIAETTANTVIDQDPEASITISPETEDNDIAEIDATIATGEADTASNAPSADSTPVPDFAVTSDAQNITGDDLASAESTSDTTDDSTSAAGTDTPATSSETSDVTDTDSSLAQNTENGSGADNTGRPSTSQPEHSATPFETGTSNSDAALPTADSTTSDELPGTLSNTNTATSSQENTATPTPAVTQNGSPETETNTTATNATSANSGDSATSEQSSTDEETIPPASNGDSSTQSEANSTLQSAESTAGAGTPGTPSSADTTADIESSATSTTPDTSATAEPGTSGGSATPAPGETSPSAENAQPSTAEATPPSGESSADSLPQSSDGQSVETTPPTTAPDNSQPGNTSPPQSENAADAPQSDAQPESSQPGDTQSNNSNSPDAQAENQGNAQGAEGQPEESTESDNPNSGEGETGNSASNSTENNNASGNPSSSQDSDASQGSDSESQSNTESSSGEGNQREGNTTATDNDNDPARSSGDDDERAPDTDSSGDPIDAVGDDVQPDIDLPTTIDESVILEMPAMTLNNSGEGDPSEDFDTSGAPESNGNGVSQQPPPQFPDIFQRLPNWIIALLNQ